MTRLLGYMDIPVSIAHAHISVLLSLLSTYLPYLTFYPTVTYYIPLCGGRDLMREFAGGPTGSS